MILTIYTNFSKRQNSTKQPAGGTQHYVYLKDACSILHPVFLIDGVDTSANYCQWEGRYYFIDDIVLNNQNIYELHCTFDPLASWKAVIGSSTQYVLRSASQSDGNIIDMFYPSKKDPVVINTDPTVAPTLAGDLSSGWYVVGIISGSSSTSASRGVVQYYAFNDTQFNTFAQNVFTEANWTDIQTSDRYSFNPIQYVASVKWFPFEPPIAGSTISSLKIGWQSIPVTCYPLALGTDIRSYQWTVPVHPQAAARGNFLNSAPYSGYFVSIPPFGDIILDSDIVSKLYDHKLYGSLKVDYITGRAILRLRGQMSDQSHDYEFERRAAQYGVTIQISQIAADRVGLVSGAVGTAAGIVGSLLTGNVLGAVTGAVSGIASAYQTAQPRVSSNGVNDSLAGICGALTSPVLYSTFYQIVDEDNADYGRPLCKTRTISTLSGYILCAHAEIDIAGLPEERDAIVSYLNSGFFYE